VSEKIKEYTQYPSVEKWLLNLKPSSRKAYLPWLKRFCEYVNLNPEQVLQNAKSDKEALHDRLKAFRQKLESDGLASKSYQTGYITIRSFLAWNGAKMDKMPRAYKGRTRYESSRIIEPWEVNKMISFGKSIRDKAIISFIYQSAQRIGVLPALRYRHIRTQLERNINPIIVDVKGDLINSAGVNVNKSSTPYRFAIGKECSDLLRQMIRERIDAGEAINDDSWLFRSYSRRVGPGFRRIAQSERGPALTGETCNDLIKEAAEKAGIQVKMDIGKSVIGQQKVKYEIHAHAFRRAWKSAMRKGGVVDSELLDFMLGHELAYQGAYDKFDPPTLSKAYAQAEPYLTCMTTPDVTEAIEVKEWEQKHPDVLKALPEEMRVKYDSKPPSGKVQWWKATMAQMKPDMSKSKHKKGQRMIIKASEIDNHCNHGWRAVFQFQDGRVQVEYDGEEQND